MKRTRLIFFYITFLLICNCSRVYYFQIDGFLESSNMTDSLNIDIRAENGMRPVIDHYTIDKNGSYSVRFYFNNLLPSDITFKQGERVIQKGRFVLTEKERYLKIDETLYVFELTEIKKDLPCLVVKNVRIKNGK